ncbi:hypothetical protein [Bradyrhizobium diazoefficiens]|uniref:hypothetical protein n=1 Tax=Bradyrhizobium diazoefficiens TaxID=1355477 RepID=UPI000577F9AD|nr:hypothetical protein [Bradyrhizobium diazoefficiens]
MMEKKAPRSAAERKRAQRQRMRERGQPDAAAFDSALPEHVLGLYQAGELSIQIPDLVQAVVERLAAAGTASDRGCRETVRAAREGQRGRPACSRMTIGNSRRT